jgi:hypothetical protein
MPHGGREFIPAAEREHENRDPDGGAQNTRDGASGNQKRVYDTRAGVVGRSAAPLNLHSLLEEIALHRRRRRGRLRRLQRLRGLGRLRRLRRLRGLRMLRRLGGLRRFRRLDRLLRERRRQRAARREGQDQRQRHEPNRRRHIKGPPCETPIFSLDDPGSPRIRQPGPERRRQVEL